MECCSNHWIKNDVKELDLRLKSQLIGQPLAYDLILRSIKSHTSNLNPSKSLVLSLHGGTGTGKNFVAKHIVESLYREGYKSKYVRLYVVSRDFMHHDPAHISQYKDHLTEDIEKITSKCPQATFVFDEIDQMPKQLLDVILYYIDFHTPTASRPTDYRKTIFIFLSNTGAKSIINLAEKNYRSSIKRENFNILEFQQALSNASSNEEGGLQSASLIDRHLVTFFVPFLPLKREHIRVCISRQLAIVLEHDEYEYELSVDDIINSVINLIEFTRASSSSLEYSLSGCKKVQQKLHYIFESMQSALKKTKKKLYDSDDLL
ncbi:unnamed protein product [Rotaria magnacalcarata]|nr:unnamed protein product [Rotaria magnacalcarata]CAF1947022.1 unnamed protein product [Rotaria magnacalcarata]CAF2159566.1 unnamed protein product [Rotaria magnacalcarata]